MAEQLLTLARGAGLVGSAVLRLAAAQLSESTTSCRVSSQLQQLYNSAGSFTPTPPTPPDFTTGLKSDIEQDFDLDSPLSGSSVYSDLPDSEVERTQRDGNNNINSVNYDSGDISADISSTSVENVVSQDKQPHLSENVDPVSRPILAPRTTSGSVGVSAMKGALPGTLSSSARERRVPSSRVARLLSFGGLAAGLGAGALAEMARRSVNWRRKDPNKSSSSGDRLTTLNGGDNTAPLLAASPLLTDANAERIVATLCRVRGAALKLGQLLSLQDESMVDSRLQRIFERVRQSADFMPRRQLHSVLAQEFGADWRALWHEFDERPFAAASIGQVHRAAELVVEGSDGGRPLAVKVQYPGVARGISSDIDNLMSVMSVWRVLPEGLFVDNIVAVAKRELAWECDYRREAACARHMKQLLTPHVDRYYVPDVIDHLSTEQVLTTELVTGSVPLDQCKQMDQPTRDHVCSLLLELCVREVFQWRFMQTDPNWSNFLYDPDHARLTLLDFGACRQFDKPFIDVYIDIIAAAAERDDKTVLDKSVELGFLTGYESRAMQQAHVEAVLILGEAFGSDAPFDFGQQSTTRRIQRLVPVMLEQRLCPPPEQTYSLHRKMSGVFLLCARLGARVACRPMFDDIYRRYKNGEFDQDLWTGSEEAVVS